MLSTQKIYELSDIEIISETALLRKIAAGLVGIANHLPVTGGIAPFVAGVQASRHKTYQNLADKLNNRAMTKEPSVALGILGGLVPIVSIYFLVSRQAKMEKLKLEIKSKLEPTQIKKLDELKEKLYNGTITEKEMKELDTIELKIQKKFTPTEINGLLRMLKS